MLDIRAASGGLYVVDRYITICVRGDFRVLAAADRRRAAARVNARAQSARASGLPPG